MVQITYLDNELKNPFVRSPTLDTVMMVEKK